MRIQDELDRKAGSEGAPSARRQERLKRDRDRIDGERVRIIEAVKKLRLDETGLPQFMGRYLVAELAARRLLLVVNMFLAVMVFLIVLGGIYSGWRLTWVPVPEFWAALTFPAIGFAYTALVGRDISAEATRFNRKIQPGFKGSMQHRTVGPRVHAGSGLRLGSSNRGLFGVGR